MKNHFTRKYLEAFPFSNFAALDDPSYFFYMFEKKGRKALHKFSRNTMTSLEDAREVIDIDFNKQSCHPLKVVDDILYIISDKDNEENFNIFAIDLKTKKISKITENEYTACVRVSDDGIAYYSSRKKDENGLFQNEIHIHNLKTNEDEVVINDEGDLYRVGWGPVTPSKNKEYLLLNVDRNNERTNDNFCLVNLKEKTKEILIPKEFESGRFYLIDNEVDTDNGFYFVSDCSGFDNLYYFTFKNSEISKLTNVDYLTEGFDYLESEGTRYFYHTKIIPSEGKTHILACKEDSPGVISKIDGLLSFEGEIGVSSKNKDFIWVGESNLTQPLTRILYKIKDSKWNKEFAIPFVKKSSEQLVHSTYEYIKYPSFDDLEIPGYVIIPKGKIKGAIITSFYGGGNYFNPSFQIMAELGFISLSPAVRGSWGHGKEWEEKLKGDLGGNEILDILWGAKFLEQKFGLKPSEIGIEGGSHGGYSTLRALTLPKGFKGQESQYPFGFGICWAGFADLVDFYKTSNIPDWLANMLGPFEENKDLYDERSPVNYFEELNTPLFITHGTKDSRVPPSTMDGFLEKLKASDVPHYIYLMDGQGHTGGSIDERVDEYKTMFHFLENTTKLGWEG